MHCQTVGFSQIIFIYRCQQLSMKGKSKLQMSETSSIKEITLPRLWTPTTQFGLASNRFSRFGCCRTVLSAGAATPWIHGSWTILPFDRNGDQPARTTQGPIASLPSPARLRGEFGIGAHGLAPTGRSLTARPHPYCSSSQPLILVGEQKGLSSVQ